MSLGLNLCIYVPRTLESDEPNTGSSTAVLVSPMASSSSTATSTNTTPTAVASEEQSHGKVKGGAGALMPTTPTPTSDGLCLSKSDRGGRALPLGLLQGRGAVALSHAAVGEEGLRHRGREGGTEGTVAWASGHRQGREMCATKIHSTRWTFEIKPNSGAVTRANSEDPDPHTI
jgi:hypothetical protein